MTHNFNVYTGNRLEVLAERLAETLAEPLTSPFRPEIIVVQSMGMERWLSLELARHQQISAHCEFPFPNAFLQQLFKLALPALPEPSLFDPDVMALRIMEMLPRISRMAPFKSLDAYLVEDGDGRKRLQLAEKIADIFDQYLVFRPEMMAAWERGTEDHWQAHLWRMLAAGNEKRHRAALQNELLAALKNPAAAIPGLPERVSIFGISYLPPLHMQVFEALSARLTVNLFALNPCREYWVDIVSSRESSRYLKRQKNGIDTAGDLHLEGGNRLLSSLGTLGRDFFNRIFATDYQLYETYRDPGCDTLLACIQSDILNLRDARPADPPARLHPDDASVQIHSCHSPMREVEVLYDHLLAMLDDETGLTPADVIVMTPDIETYAPYIQAVFDAQTDPSIRIPYSIADRNVKNESPLIDGFQALLELNSSRVGVSEIFDLLEFDCISSRFDIYPTDLQLLGCWIEDTHIRWGLSAESRRKAGVPDFKDNTWQAGLERMLLGYALPGGERRLFEGLLPYDPIEGPGGMVLGRFLVFMERVQNLLKGLEKPRKIEEWHLFLHQVLDDFFLSSDATTQSLLRLRREIDRLQEAAVAAGFDTPVTFVVVQTFLKRRIEAASFGYGFISGGVTFCAMLPMRSIPFAVVCLLGMNSDAFPREQHRPAFDLLAKYPRPGDRSRRNDDKYLFLEALLSARRRFYISYMGQDLYDNTALPPSVLVSELLDYITQRYDPVPDRLVTLQRLQAFSPAYFQNGSRLFSYSSENLAACRGMLASAGRDKQPERPLMPLPPPAAEALSDAVDLEELAAFWTHPARFFSQHRLGIFLEDGLGRLEDREHFNLDALERHTVAQELLKRKVAGEDSALSWSIQRSKGSLPPGVVGETLYRDIGGEVNSFARRFDRWLKSGALGERDVDVKLEEGRLVGRLTGICSDGLARVVFAKTKIKYIIKSWIYHLILNVIDEVHPASFLICKDVLWCFKPAADAEALLATLMAFYRRGQQQPLPFFPETSLEYVRQRTERRQPDARALSAARRKWAGNDFVPGEGRDPYVELFFGGSPDPLGSDPLFGSLAGQILEPMLAHLVKGDARANLTEFIAESGMIDT